MTNDVFSWSAHPYLIVSKESIYEAKQLVARSGVYQLVIAWQRVTILRESLVYVSEIYAHSPLAVCLFDHCHIGQSIRIVHVSNKLCHNQLLNFIFYSIISLRGKHPLLLSHWLGGRTYI